MAGRLGLPRTSPARLAQLVWCGLPWYLCIHSNPCNILLIIIINPIEYIKQLGFHFFKWSLVEEQFDLDYIKGICVLTIEVDLIYHLLTIDRDLTHHPPHWAHWVIFQLWDLATHRHKLEWPFAFWFIVCQVGADTHGRRGRRRITGEFKPASGGYFGVHE